MLNFKVRMIPEYYPFIEGQQEEAILYRVEKMFNLDRVLDIMYDIDFASWQISQKFDTIYGYQTN